MTNGAAVNIYEAVIADLEAKIATMQATVDNLRALSGSSRGTTPTPIQQSSGSNVVFPTDAFFGMTVGDAVKKYLGGTKKTANVATISEALVAGGWKTSAKNIPENVRAIISRTAGIVRINGEFGLAEWYPGRKNPPKRTQVVGMPYVEFDSDDATKLAETTAPDPRVDIISSVPAPPSARYSYALLESK